MGINSLARELLRIIKGLSQGTDGEGSKVPKTLDVQVTAESLTIKVVWE